jgi:hypothetical protein
MQDTKTSTHSHPENQEEPEAVASQEANPELVDYSSVNLPSGYEWNDEVTSIMGVAVGVALDENINVEVEAENETVDLRKKTVGVVAEGLPALTAKADTVERIQSPACWSEIHSLTPVYFSATSKYIRSQKAWGVPRAYLEGALRFVVSCQNCALSEVSILLLHGANSFVVVGPSQTFVFMACSMEMPDTVEFTREAAGMMIPNETDDNVLEGIERLSEILGDLGIKLEDALTNKSGRITFETASGFSVTVKGYLLSRLARYEDCLNALEGTYQVEPRHSDATYSYEWPPGITEHEPGEMIFREDCRSPRSFSGDAETIDYVHGYQKRETRIEHGRSGSEYGVGIRVKAQPGIIRIHVDGEAQQIDIRNRTRIDSETIEEVAFDKPDHHDPSALSNVTLWDS